MNKMGADIKIDGNQAVICGGRPLTGTQVQAGDLRGGAALIIAALMAVTLFSGLAWFAGDAGEFGLYAFGLKTAEVELVQSTVYMGVLLALACALPLVTVFLFRRRLLQIRLCVVEMVLLLGSLVMEGVYYFLSWRVFSDLTFHTQGFKPAIVLPLVCLLFAYLAARAIFRDELLVRAADRIR